MIDLRPVAYVIGLLVAALGAAMLLPMVLDLASGNGHWPAFLKSALISALVGGLVSISSANAVSDRLTLQQTFLLTTSVWLALPLFGALPFIFGATESRLVDAFFEAMSGLTTTGSTVLVDLDNLPEGLLLWRGLLQWFGGIGIIVVAMVFLPELRVGGMQIFRSEAFETDGKILPRATEIAGQISGIYLVLTMVCAVTYFALGMSGFDAVVHAMTTIATGGFASYDASFGGFGAAAEMAACIFMILAALPFVRYIQIVAGSARPLLQDSQVHVFLCLIAAVTVMISIWIYFEDTGAEEPGFRNALFNVTSIVTGTGYSRGDYGLWGAFPVTLIFFAGLIGGCAGSTACSVKVFRYQILFAAIKAQIQTIHSPHGVFRPRFQGKIVSQDVMDSVMSFFVLFVLSLGVVSVLLTFAGLDVITAVSGAATAMANIGPGLGPEIGPAGNFAGLNDTAKWILSAAMLVGRLELLVVYTILTVSFWRS